MYNRSEIMEDIGLGNIDFNEFVSQLTIKDAKELLDLLEGEEE